MAATIKIKNSSTTGAVPTSGDLVQGELAVNVTDTGLYTENASGTVVKLNAPSIDDKNTGATKHLTISTGGNLGLGVTPSAWSVGKAIEHGFLGSAEWGVDQTSTYRTTNAYFNGSWKYAGTGLACNYAQEAGKHYWSTAASGTAGNAITFTQAMTLDASGNLGIGTTSPTVRLEVAGGDAKVTAAGNGTRNLFFGTSATNYQTIKYDDSTGALTIGSIASAYPVIFQTQGAERARIDSSGNLLVGKTVTTLSTVGSYVTSSGEAGITRDGGESLNLNRLSSDGQIARFFRQSSLVGSISVTTTATAYNTSSDYRLKNITGSLTGYKERLSALQPKQGSWKVDGSEFRGFLAHEFAVSYPASVNGEKDAVDTDGNPQYQGMQAGSSEVIADLVAYIKELETRLSALEQA